MEPDVLGVLLPYLAVPAVLVAGWWFHRRRQEAVRAWAAGVGWQVVGTDPSLVHRWRGRPFGTGGSRRVSELVVGRFAGRPAMSFCYRYTTGSGKNRSTVTHHVVALGLPTYLPTVELTPDGLGAKVAKAFGGQDIAFESEDFNRVWRVTAPDPRFAHAVVHPRLMERLLRPDAAGLSLRVEGTDVLCWSLGTPRLEAVGPRLQVLTALVEQVPRFVWLDHGYDPDATLDVTATAPAPPAGPPPRPAPLPARHAPAPPAATTAPPAPAPAPPAPGGEPWT